MEDCVRAGWREIHQRGTSDTGTESFDEFWNSVLEAGVWGQRAHRTAQAPVVPARLIEDIKVDEANLIFHAPTRVDLIPAIRRACDAAARQAAGNRIAVTAPRSSNNPFAKGW